MISNKKFRVSADIKFNNKKINDLIIEEYQEKMERIVYVGNK
jgi:hypothetical protein